MSDFIIIPSFLIPNDERIKESISMRACSDCEILCTGCMGSGCESSCTSGCTSSCTSSCTTSQCGGCQVVCTSCEGCLVGQGLPQLPTPTLDTSATIKTANSIQVTINRVSGATHYYARINGANEQSSESRTFLFTNLIPNTQYLIEIKVYGAGYEDSNWGRYQATTSIAELWEWHTPKTSGLNFNITSTEWLDFCNKINEVRVAKGMSQYSFTTSPTYISKGKDFYSWIFKQGAESINQINGQVASQCLNVKSGDVIYAWYFDNLKSALNNAISSL